MHMLLLGKSPKTYESVNKEIQALIAFLEKKEIYPGDKVAILSLNMPNWGIAYFSITFMGAVVVPILPDFSPTEVANVLEHSGAKGTIHFKFIIISELKDSNQKF